MFLLQTNATSYAFGIDDRGLVRHLYWGKRIDAVEDFEMPVLTEVSTNDPVFEITKEEFPVYGSLRYKDATETTGEVFFGALRMSGNFSGVVEQTQYGENLVQLGLNSHDLLLELKPGESFSSPAILCGYSLLVDASLPVKYKGGKRFHFRYTKNFCQHRMAFDGCVCH